MGREGGPRDPRSCVPWCAPSTVKSEYAGEGPQSESTLLGLGSVGWLQVWLAVL